VSIFTYVLQGVQPSYGYADGSSITGEIVLENGLIDKICGMFEVKEYLQADLNEPIAFSGG